MADGQIVTTRNPVHLKDYTPPAYAVDEVALEFDLDPEATRVRARLHLRRQGPGELVLDGRELELLSISVNGEALGGNRYTLTPQKLTLHDMPETCTLETTVRIAPSRNTELSGLYTSGSGFFTQCEPEGFRRITFFPDRPDVMARYHVVLRADRKKYPVLLSNGNFVASGIAGEHHWAEWRDPHPKPSYLFALVAADLVEVADRFVTRSGREVKLGIWVEAGDETRCLHAMRALKNAMKWDEDVFGLEYDLDIFNIAAVSDFNAGAMENKGLNIFNTSCVLASAETATDAEFQSVERVIAHEYFHNWTGDRVTCRDWFQLSLKEGLTVFRDQEYMADRFSAAVKRIADARLLRATQFRTDAGPLAHPVRPETYLEINNFYTTTIYEKGAEVVRMYQTLLGREKFRRGMDLYIARHDNSAATVEDFFTAMQDAAPEIDLAQLMRWYAQAGTPEISFEESHDAAKKTFTLTLRQRTPPTPGQPEKLPLLIPVAMALLDGQGRELHAETLQLREAEQHFVFENIEAPPVPSLLRHFSAPVKLKGQSRERLAFLAAHDTDPFNRWDALQGYATSVLLEAVAAHQEGQAFVLDAGLCAAIRNTLAGAEADPAFAAETLKLPSETLLGDAMAVVDPEAVHAVRQAALAALGQALRAEFGQVYERFAGTDPADISGPAMAARALKNAALFYLCAAEGSAAAAAQFSAARNMTDIFSAFICLNDHADARRDAALERFYADWRHVPLVLDKWFAVQANAAAPDTLARVRALLGHPEFNLKNPNRARALLGNFSANQAKFHDKSGAGYRLLGQAILELDAINPQIAARLVTAFGVWRRFGGERQALMKAELERILAREHLSHNTYEMASKALA